MHVLCWSHLDREWNLPYETTRADMVQLVDDLMDIMEKRRDYRFFHLDGQVVPLEDYLEYRPENRARVKRLTKSGRLLIGPWYSLPEMNVIQGECIARNLLRGRTAAEEFGGVMKIGFTNTGWGQVSQMPQILTEFGIDTYTSYRGVPVHRIDKESLWEGPDGSRVILFRPTLPPRGTRSRIIRSSSRISPIRIRSGSGRTISGRGWRRSGRRWKATRQPATCG
jgi:mannosylglycerate hydrolase